jgi:hypothetical protein
LKDDTPGFLDVKLTAVTKDAGPWLEGLLALGEVEVEEQLGDWAHRHVRTSAVLRDLTIRVNGYVGAPTADVRIGWIGADRILSDGLTELPDVSMAEVPRVTGTPSKDTWLAALKEVLRDAAKH